LCIDYPEAGHHFLDLRLHPHERIRWQDLALAAAQKLKDRQSEGFALNKLGIAWNQLSEVRKSIEYYEQALAIAREVGDRHGEGNALGNLGNAWRQLGDQAKAVELMEASLKILEGIKLPKAQIVQQWLDQIRSG
jgi:tetratricopeptide (TPR) repeat protein